MDMNSALFIAGGLAVLLLFGCVGAPKEKPPQPPAPSEDVGSGLGDADISSPESEADMEVLPEEELLIPPVEEEPAGDSGDSGLTIDVSDVLVDEGSDFDFISEEDIIEPL